MPTRTQNGFLDSLKPTATQNRFHLLLDLLKPTATRNTFPDSLMPTSNTEHTRLQRKFWQGSSRSLHVCLYVLIGVVKFWFISVDGQPIQTELHQSVYGDDYLSRLGQEALWCAYAHALIMQPCTLYTTHVLLNAHAQIVTPPC